MAKQRFPTTQAIRKLKEHGVDFSLHLYKCEEKGGTVAAATELNVDEHLVIKTLVMEDDKGDPLLILMHGDRKVSTKAPLKWEASSSSGVSTWRRWARTPESAA